MIILSIDPGNEMSAFTVWNGKQILCFGKNDNYEMFGIINGIVNNYKPTHFVVEKVASYGMSVGQTVFDTCVWSGRFIQYFIDLNEECITEEIFRKDVKLHHCGVTKAKDSNIIQALKDRFEPGLQPRQRPKSLLKGLTADVWQAFALAVYCYDTNCN